MGINIDVTEARVELEPSGRGYLTEWYDLLATPSVSDVMTNLSCSGWRLHYSQYVYRDERHFLLCIWEWHGVRGGVHFRKHYEPPRW